MCVIARASGGLNAAGETATETKGLKLSPCPSQE